MTQVSECIKQLQTESNLPIQRARMRVRVSMPAVEGKRLRDKVLEGAEKIEDDEMGQEEWKAVRSFPLHGVVFSSCSL
jgi:ribosome maturation protein SDO1